MCGIAGKISGREAADEALLERMCAAIRHRGPDGRGTFTEDGAALGIQRLAVIDTATGDQPIFSEDGSVVVVLNGEIYNYRELRSELETRGHRFSTQGDTEVIVHLYEDHGDACVEHLRGMFAFALWDRRRERLLCARDRFGKKPFFYVHRGGELWFGSSPMAILQDESVPRVPDLEAIDRYLHLGYVPHPMSAFEGMRKLEPGHLLTFDRDGLETGRYWKLSFEPKLELSEPELHEAVREELLTATRLRLRSDVPLGAFLSGGVDSSAVVAAMAKTSSSTVRTFSIGFGEERLDERRFAREVAELYGTDHTELEVTPDALAVMPQLAWHYGEPFADSSAIPSFYLAELARSQVTVALNGDGGDEAFAGYNRYFGVDMASRVPAALAPVARLLASGVERAGTGVRMDSIRGRVQRLAHAAGTPTDEAYSGWMAWFSEAERRSLYSGGLLGELDVTDARAAFAKPYAESDAKADLDRVLDIDSQSYLPGDLLVKMDVATMAHSLEVRSPLLDQEVWALAARVPARTKVEGRVSKRVLKDALRPWLPDHLLDRQKQGFMVPLAEWFRGELRDLPETVLLDPRSTARGLFDPGAVRTLISDHHSGRNMNANKLWSLIQLELWLRTYTDRRPDGPITLDV